MSQLVFELPRSGREGGRRETLSDKPCAELMFPVCSKSQFIDQDGAVASHCNARPSPGMREGNKRSVSSLLAQFSQIRVFGKRCHNFCTGF